MHYPAFDKRVGPFDKGHQQHPDRGQRSAPPNRGALTGALRFTGIQRRGEISPPT